MHLILRNRWKGCGMNSPLCICGQIDCTKIGKGKEFALRYTLIYILQGVARLLTCLGVHMVDLDK